MKAGSCVSHFNVSLILWAKSRDSVHKLQFLKRTESQSGSNRGSSAHESSALPLGHTGSRTDRFKDMDFITDKEEIKGVDFRTDIEL